MNSYITGAGNYDGGQWIGTHVAITCSNSYSWEGPGDPPPTTFYCKVRFRNAATNSIIREDISMLELAFDQNGVLHAYNKLTSAELAGVDSVSAQVEYGYYQGSLVNAITLGDYSGFCWVRN